MFFTSDDQRQRHRFVDASLEVCDWTLRRPDIGQSLSEVEVKNLQTLFHEVCFVPNIHHGVVAAPRRLSQRGRVPILPIREGETIQLGAVDYLVPTDFQMSRVREKALSWSGEASRAEGLISYMGRGFRQSAKDNGAITIEYPHTVLGMVVSSPTYQVSLPRMWNVGNTLTREILSCPKMVLPMALKETRKSPTVMIHEATHVAQTLSSPVISPGNEEDRHWRNELEAYNIAAIIDLILLSNDYQPTPNERYDATYDMTLGYPFPVSSSLTIDSLRAKTNENRRDKFFPNGTLKKTLRELGVDSVGF